MQRIDARIRDLGIASRVLSRQEADECEKIAEVAKSVLLSKAKAFIENNAENPLLFCYASDTTPLRTSVRYVFQVGQPRKVHREGGSLSELLMQKGFLKRVSASGEHEVLALLHEPGPMGKGKSALYAYT